MYRIIRRHSKNESDNQEFSLKSAEPTAKKSLHKTYPSRDGDSAHAQNKHGQQLGLAQGFHFRKKEFTVPVKSISHQAAGRPLLQSAGALGRQQPMPQSAHPRNDRARTGRGASSPNEGPWTAYYDRAV